MKMEHIKLLEEAEAYKKYEADISELGLIIKSKSNYTLWHYESQCYICLVFSFCVRTNFFLISLFKVNEQLELSEDLKSKYIEGTKIQKELYNKVLELRGNIRVFCRCRPLNAEEIKGGATVALDFDSSKDGELTVMSNGSSKKTFKFDAVFGPQVEQGN